MSKDNNLTKLDSIQAFLDEYINPALKSHNGFLTITRYDEEVEDIKILSK